MKIKKEHLEALKRQFCIDYNCSIQDFEQSGNIITLMEYHPKRRRYVNCDPMFRMVSFYDKVIITAEKSFYQWAVQKYSDCFSGWVFSMEEIRSINEQLARENQYVSDLHHYFLPLCDFPGIGETGLDLVWVEQAEIEMFRDSGMYEDAFAFNRFHPDVLGVIALDKTQQPQTDQEKKLGGRIMGAAGASADGKELWQIGITVASQYRGSGVAVKLVTLLKEEVIHRGKVPFYGTMESHNLSNSVAIRSGFFPVWSEMITSPLYPGTQTIETERLLLRKMKSSEQNNNRRLKKKKSETGEEKMLTEVFQIQVEGSLPQAKLYTYILDQSEELFIKKRPLILMCPGGGYGRTSDREAEPLAMRFLAMGYHVAVLRYSCAPAVYPTALLEAASAMKLIHDYSEEWNVDADKIIVQGCSAGGHLAASLGVFWHEKWIADKTGVKNEMLRPAALLLCYPVITAGEYAHRGSIENLLKGQYTEKMLDRVSLEKQVTEHTPPVFLWHTYTDDAVPVENSLLFIQALKKYNTPVEFHMYPVGGHGLSTCDEQAANAEGYGVQRECESWLALARSWLKDILWIK